MFINQYLWFLFETFLFYKKMNLFAKKKFQKQTSIFILNFFLSNYINIQFLELTNNIIVIRISGFVCIIINISYLF